MKYPLNRWSPLTLCVLSACGGGGVTTTGTITSVTPSPVISTTPPATTTTSTTSTTTTSTVPVVAVPVVLPPAIETCPVSPAGAGTVAVATTVEVQSAAGWENARGRVSVAANGVRTGREFGLASQVNCVSWRGADGNARALNLGAFMFDYVMNATSWPRTVASDDVAGHAGFGYVVSHAENGNAPIGSSMNPTSVNTQVFAGANHAVHRITLNYKRDALAGGQGVEIPVVIEWLVAAGRDHPVWIVNWDMGHVVNPNNINFDNGKGYTMDSRGPYGAIGWDGKTGANSEAIGQVEWGIGGYQFIAKDADGVTSGTSWTNNTPSVANYTKAITTGTQSLEFGLVQTAPDKFMGYSDFVAGRLDGKTSADYVVSATDPRHLACPLTNSVMPCSSYWPYQMMQFSGADGSFAATRTGGKLMAWGTKFGWLGASSVLSYDGQSTATGQGDRSYSTFVVWGRNGGLSANTDPVSAATSFVDAATAVVTRINGGIGAVATGGIPPRANAVRSLPANGYDQTYGTFKLLVSANNKVDVTFSLPTTDTRVLQNPVVTFDGYVGAAPLLLWNGAVQTAGTDYHASYDNASKRLWVTFLKKVSAASPARIQLGL